MGSRTKMDVEITPIRGDVVDIKEWIIDEVTGGEFQHESMLRVVAVHEDRIWFKEYGKGHVLQPSNVWTSRLQKPKSTFTVVQFGNEGC
jgi:hypothetical protein